MENRSREKVSKTRKLLLTIEDVAELTGLPADFWAYVAEHESEWDARSVLSMPEDPI